MVGLAEAVQQIMIWTWQATWRASLLIGLVLVIRRLLARRLSARWIYALWVVVMVRLLLPAGPGSSLSLFNLVPRGAEVQMEVPAASPSLPTPESAAIDQVPPSPQSVAPWPAVPVSPAAAGVSSSDSAKPRLTWLSVLAWVWLAGALALAVHIGASHVRLRWVVRQQRAVTSGAVLDVLEDCRSTMKVSPLLGVVVTDRVQTPSLFGFIRPKLLLPAGVQDSLPGPELRHVFMHELAHLRRHDIELGWLASLCQVLHWFNPLVWLAFHQMRADREMACDQLAISCMSGRDDASDYGRTLVRLLEVSGHQRTLAALAGISEGKGQLLARMEAIVHPARLGFWGLVLALGVVGVIGIIGLTDAKSSVQTLADKPIPAELRDKVIEYYAFDTAQGQTAEDLSPRHRHSQVRGGRHVRDGFGGGAWASDGRDGYLSLDRLPREAFTVSAWFRPSAQDTEMCRTVLLFGTEEGRFSLEANGAGRIGWSEAGAAGYGGSGSSGNAMALNSPWMHVALTWDRGVVRVYQNGEICRVATVDLKADRAWLCIGGGTYGSSWLGLMDEVAVFNGSLEPAQIRGVIKAMGFEISPAMPRPTRMTAGPMGVPRGIPAGPVIANGPDLGVATLVSWWRQVDGWLRRPAESDTQSLQMAMSGLRSWRMRLDISMRGFGRPDMTGPADDGQWQTRDRKISQITELLVSLRTAMDAGSKASSNTSTPALPTGRMGGPFADPDRLRLAIDRLIRAKDQRTKVSALAGRLADLSAELTRATEARDDPAFAEAGQQMQQTWDEFTDTLGMERTFRPPAFPRTAQRPSQAAMTTD